MKWKNVLENTETIAKIRERGKEFIIHDKVKLCAVCGDIVNLGAEPIVRAGYDVTMNELYVLDYTSIYYDCDYISLAKEIVDHGKYACASCKEEAYEQGERDEEGPFGGAFSSWESYYTWREGSNFFKRG